MTAIISPSRCTAQSIVAVLTVVLAVFAHSTKATAEDMSRAATQTYNAAVRGDPDAQATLAKLYATGDGVPQSDAKALQWLLRAANQGHADAALRLSEVFVGGKGVPVNYVQAYKWAFLSALNAKTGARQTRDDAAKALEDLAQKMSSADVADARSQASRWTAVPEAKQPVQTTSASKDTDGASKRHVSRAKSEYRAKQRRRRGSSFQRGPAIRMPF